MDLLVPEFLWWISLFVLVVSYAAALTATIWLFLPSWSKWFATTYWNKLSIELAQGAAALVGIGGGLVSAEQKAVWIPLSVAGIVGLAVLRWVEYRCDNVRKALAEAEKSRLAEERRTQDEELARLEEELAVERSVSELRARMSAALRQSAHEISDRLLRAVQKLDRQGAKATIRHARETLDPKLQVQFLLRDLASLFRDSGGPQLAEKANVRCGLYVERLAIVTPIAAVDLRDLGYQPSRSFNDHQTRFHRNASEPAEVVKCIAEKSLRIIEDTVKAESEGRFRFFNDNQRSYLRSMAVVYIGAVADGTSLADAVIVLDSDAPLLFREQDFQDVKLVVNDFAARIRAAAALEAFLEVNTRGTKP